MSYRLCLVLFMIIVTLFSQAQAQPGPGSGPYMGYDPPGSIPVVFAPGHISGSGDDRMLQFLRDGRECYFQRRSETGAIVYYTYLAEDRWTDPDTAFFSGHYFEEYAFSSDGNTLVFTSDRPCRYEGNGRSQFFLWKSVRQNKRWTDPVLLPAHFEGAGYPSVADNGDIYYFDNREQGAGQEDIWYSSFSQGIYATPAPLGIPVNSPFNEVDPCIAPGGEYLIFSSDRNKRCGLYVTFRKAGGWSEPRYMGEQIGRGESICPHVTGDGSYLFFTSLRSIQGETPNNNIFWVDAEVIGHLKNKYHE